MATINLLPPEFKENIFYSKKNIKAIRRLWMALVLISLLTLAFFAIYKFLSVDLGAVKREVSYEEENIRSYGSLEKDAKELSDHLETIKKIENDYPYFSKILTKIGSVMPANLNLTSIKVAKDTKQRVQLSGLADSKRTVAAFRESLENSAEFSYVDIESILLNEDLKEKFTLTLTLEKGSLK